MTQRTKAAMATQISTLLADNTSGDISASDVRSVFSDSVDSLAGGPASATDNTLVRFDGTTGQLVQGSGIVVDDSDNLSAVASIAIANGGALKTDTTTAHTAVLQAYDVDGTAYKTFATLTNGNTPSLAIAAPAGGTVSIDGAVIGATTALAATVTTMTATGGVIATGLRVDAATAISAAGTSVSDATALTASINHVTTVSASTAGVKLPACAAGKLVFVNNLGANAMHVYGAGSDTVDGAAAGTGVVLTNPKRAIFMGISAAAWISMTGVAAT